MAAESEQSTAPLRVTDAAREKILAFLAGSSKPNGAIRVAIEGRSSAGFRYSMGIVDRADRDADDLVLDGGGFDIYVDPRTLEHMPGTTVDYVEEIGGGGIKIENPNPVWSDPIALAVQEIIDARINPGVASHGGHVELLDVRGDTAYVALGGGCQGCGLADVTLKQGIEVMIREAVPQIAAVIDSTDHAAGSNPYYQPAKG